MNGIKYIYAASLQARFCTLVAKPIKSIIWWDAAYLPLRYVIMVIDGNYVTFGGWNMGCCQNAKKVCKSAE